MLNTMSNSKKTDGTMTMSERRLVANAMVKAGHKNVKPEMVCKVPNKYGFDVYVGKSGIKIMISLS